MQKINQYIQNEMDAIVVKTLHYVQQILDQQGREPAEELILMIAAGIKEQLLANNMSITDAEIIYDMFIAEINAAIFDKKH
ncbi:MAG: hypothetical protein QM479_06760 [Pseudomonadota bacterium]